MITFSDIQLISLITHYVGNGSAGDELQLSRKPAEVESADLRQVLLQYFLSPFREAPSYNLWHPADLKLNEVYSFVTAIFQNPQSLFLQSVNIAKHLFDITTLPQIKSGELHIAYFKDCPVNGRLVDAVGIYKTEARSRYLKLQEGQEGYSFLPAEGINPEQMDKGCIIFNFNTNADGGYLVRCVDRTAKAGANQFWKDTFLKVRAAADEYHITENVLRMSKLFIQEELPSEFEVERVHQIDLLNKTAAYFKKNEQFEKADFENEVLQDTDLIQSFRKYEKQYAADYELEPADHFEISDAAVKKNARLFKSVLKLDKNFHVYVHGSRDRIERGYDEKAGLNYYKIYFEEEA